MLKSKTIKSADVTITTSNTLGTWRRGADRLSAMHHGDSSVRLTNSLGHDMVVDTAEWLDRCEGMLAGGWWRAVAA